MDVTECQHIRIYNADQNKFAIDHVSYGSGELRDLEHVLHLQGVGENYRITLISLRDNLYRLFSR